MDQMYAVDLFENETERVMASHEPGIEFGQIRHTEWQVRAMDIASRQYFIMNKIKRVYVQVL